MSDLGKLEPTNDNVQIGFEQEKILRRRTTILELNGSKIVQNNTFTIVTATACRNNLLNSRILPLLGPTLILPWVQMDLSIILHYYLSPQRTIREQWWKRNERTKSVGCIESNSSNSWAFRGKLFPKMCYSCALFLYQVIKIQNIILDFTCIFYPTIQISLSHRAVNTSYTVEWAMFSLLYYVF